MNVRSSIRLRVRRRCVWGWIRVVVLHAGRRLGDGGGVSTTSWSTTVREHLLVVLDKGLKFHDPSVQLVRRRLTMVFVDTFLRTIASNTLGAVGFLAPAFLFIAPPSVVISVFESVG